MTAIDVLNFRPKSTIKHTAYHNLQRKRLEAILNGECGWWTVYVEITKCPSNNISFGPSIELIHPLGEKPPFEITVTL